VRCPRSSATATSTTDTDYVAKLTDVSPDGASIILTEGVIRARFRRGFARETLLQPHRPETYRIDLGATSNVFLPGHRIRLILTSSSYPRLDPNPNAGHPLGIDNASDHIPARQTIFHDQNRPSHLVLPVIP